MTQPTPSHLPRARTSTGEGCDVKDIVPFFKLRSRSESQRIRLLRSRASGRKTFVTTTLKRFSGRVTQSLSARGVDDELEYRVKLAVVRCPPKLGRAMLQIEEADPRKGRCCGRLVDDRLAPRWCGAGGNEVRSGFVHL